MLYNWEHASSSSTRYPLYCPRRLIFREIPSHSWLRSALNLTVDDLNLTNRNNFIGQPLKKMETGEKFPIKIVLLGDSHVGKTSIVNCWMSGRYDSSIKPTIGVNHQRIEMKIENEDVVLYIWDTAGQEQFQALTPLYARSACVALIIVSIIDQNSINHVQSWVELLRSSCDDIPPAVLVVNKIDLDDDAVFTREEILEKYFSSFQAVLFTSAKTGEGIMELFDQMTKLGYHFAKKGLRHADSAPVKDVKEKGICKC